MDNNPPAIISTLLDRQVNILDSILSFQKFDIITPKLFSESASKLALRHNIKFYIIEEALDDQEKIRSNESAKKYSSQVLENKELISSWLSKNKSSPALTDCIIKPTLNRIEKIVFLYDCLDKLNSKHDIRALALNQEYLIHESILLNWAKARNIPSIHFCHSPYLARNLGRIRHFRADYLTLTSDRCNETLDDQKTGHGHRVVTGLVNWDAYRSFNSKDITDFKNEIGVSEGTTIISFFTTYPAPACATSDPEIHSKTLNAFLECATGLIKNNKKLHFIVKDRPSGAHYTSEQVLTKCRKLGIHDYVSYIFDRPEKVVLASDIVISCGSSVSIEAMAHGKVVIELIRRHVFLGQLCFNSYDGVIQCETSSLEEEIKKVIDDKNLAVNLSRTGFNNIKITGPTRIKKATQLSASLLLKVCGYDSLSKALESSQDIYNQIDTYGSDGRFHTIDSYKTWRSRTQPNEITGQLMGERYHKWKAIPKFHIVIIADQSLFNALANTLDSFELQIYPHYGITIISPDQCPDNNLLNHPKIQWITSSLPFEMVNKSVESVESDWIMILWPGDELHPQSLFNLADYANINSDWLAIYGDEVCIKETSEDLALDQSRAGSSDHINPIFKPDFNIDLLRSTDYVNRSTAFRRDAWNAMGGVMPFAYRQTEDLVFRIAERMTLPAIGHIPSILVYRSSFMDDLISSETHENLGALIRQQHLHRCGFENAHIQPGLHPQIYNIRYQIKNEHPTTDLLIATSGLTEKLKSCLNTLSIHASDYKLKIYATTNCNIDDTLLWQEKNGLIHINVSWVYIGSNITSITSQWYSLIKESKSEFFILGVDLLRWVQPNWLTPLIDQLLRPDVAMTGPRIVSTTATIVSAGQILGKDGLVGDLYQHFFLEQDIPGLPRAWCEQNFNSLNPACIAIKRSIFNNFGGLNSSYIGGLSVTDLQLRLCTHGHKLVWTPLSSLVITDKLALPTSEERKKFMDDWFHLLSSDPSFNRNLELRSSGVYPDIILSGLWHPIHNQRTKLLIGYLDHQSQQIELASPILKAISAAVDREIILHQNYFFQKSAMQTPITSIELDRLNPDILLVIGSPNLHSVCIKEVSRYTQIQLWAVISSEHDWGAWNTLESYVNGCLFFDKALHEKCRPKTRSILVESIADATIWIEETVCNQK